MFTNATKSRLSVLGQFLNPIDVIGTKHVYGQSPHLKGADGVVWQVSRNETSGTDLLVALNSSDAAIVSVGIPSPFPTPRDKVPNPAEGFHWNIFNNIWNTVRLRIVLILNLSVIDTISLHSH